MAVHPWYGLLERSLLDHPMSLRTLARQEVPEDLEEFDAYLSRFDWFSHMSDDHRYYASGEDAQKRLTAFLKSGDAKPEHKQCYNKWHAIAYNTSAFVTPGRPYTQPYPENETRD